MPRMSLEFYNQQINRSYRYGANLTHLLTSHTHNFTTTYFTLSGEDNLDTLNNAVCRCPHLDIMSSSYPAVRLKFKVDSIPTIILKTIFLGYSASPAVLLSLN